MYTRLGATALSLVLMVGGIAIGFQTDLASAIVLDRNGIAQESWGAVFLGVIISNGPALCLVYGGVLSGGLLTLIAWPIISIYIGSTMRTGINIMGVEGVAGAIWAYAPVEFVALALAAAAGMMPVAAAVWASLSTGGSNRPLRAYLNEFPHTLRFFGIAVVTLLAAAAIEAFVITN
ncbi:hypothetical protein CVV68_12415 [Arthrobacter livingstonensis]|uniref:Stage II sporulation protein M n=1 Tax=Arthrobacter livingstonensis TaxID=670078 RepID=A0A2V5L862_9MICC|nr:hypothetical protein [Arthrobacter livingstonensis]PYI66892.1 hypothetical protein CVV68_12415 [Arthrobacter livingstonensis]